MQFDVTTFGQFIPYLFGTGGVAVAIFERRKNKAITKGVEADAESKVSRPEIWLQVKIEFTLIIYIPYLEF
ncbi:hypothetical protein PL373_07900 [Tenacibaculum maritimum]|nr:hypothetical protein [Tenacibaculum maritimum]MDB0601068.1 hypothetical protein [Tenacibaculum maritimum]MDB0612148.1 hypothetical protein [Tenacibaculum maritimum]